MLSLYVRQQWQPCLWWLYDVRACVRAQMYVIEVYVCVLCNGHLCFHNWKIFGGLSRTKCNEYKLSCKLAAIFGDIQSIGVVLIDFADFRFLFCNWKKYEYDILLFVIPFITWNIFGQLLFYLFFQTAKHSQHKSKKRKLCQNLVSFCYCKLCLWSL